ncbi:MAG: zinc-dependent alcohol dehydrogenase family protein [Verrucomicrobia bacterium]|nr:zinc-dependent alcohol dehydrogenase family protein [Verrucomicrobiota bacterium]
MKAVVYRGPGKLALEEKPQPKLEKPTDCVVQILKTTICGTDLHIRKGDVPTVEVGRTLGHEGIGIIEEAGSAVSNFKPGDKVLISCITSCSRCPSCKTQMYSHCEAGAWILGNQIDGTQAEYVRIPFADTSLYHLPKNVDEEALVMVSDIFPTGYEAGVLKGQIKLGDTVAIIGSGPIGLAALLTAQFNSPSEIIVVDVDDYRLQTAQKLGATLTINDRDGNAVKKIMEHTHQKGVNVAIEAVGTPQAFDTCQLILAPGGFLANIGVHGKSVNLHLENLWHENITVTTALVDTFTIPTLLKVIESGKLHPEKLITHRFSLGEAMKAYEVFGEASQQQALKVILQP